MGNSLVVNLYPKPNSSAGNMKMLSVTTTPSGGFAKLTDGGYTFHEDTKFVVLDVQDNDVYVTYNNNQTPSATVGHILYAGNSYTWDIQTAKAANFLSVGGTAIVAASQFTQ
jgi:hypothetical protein